MALLQVSAIMALLVVISYQMMVWLAPYMNLRFLVMSTEQRIQYKGYTLTPGENCDSIDFEDIESSQDFYESFVQRRKPVRIVVGDLEKLGWDPELFEVQRMVEHIEDESVRIESTVEGNAFGLASTREMMPFSRLVGLLNGTEPTDRLYYMNLQDEPTMTASPLSRLTRGFTVPHFFLSLPLTNINLWLGQAKEQSSNLHFDDGDNLYVVVYGRKRFRYYSPKDAFNMYTRGIIDLVDKAGAMHFALNEQLHFTEQDRPHFSNVDPLAPDFEKYPLFRNAVQGQCDLNPGDLLYLPAGWFHHVTSYDLSFALNFWSEFDSELIE